jgi:methylaspartate mutase epsilon subunit
MFGRDGCLGDIEDERAQLLRSEGTADLDLTTARDHLRVTPPERFASYAYRERPDRPYVQPRGGFPGADRQRELTLALVEAGADFVPLTIDSHTRHNDYRTAEALLHQGRRDGHDLLNGYPLISHGVRDTRRVLDGVRVPISLRHGTPDARLLTEVALACGITEIEGGGLCYTLPYSKSYPLDRALAHWQYVDRLCALTGTPELPVQRESFGPLTATLVPPVMTVVVQLCELLLAAQQGVRSFTVSFGQTGSLEQDVAIAQVLRSRATSLLAQAGIEGVTVRLAYHQWMGAFPAQRSLAWQLIAVSAMLSRLVDADKVVVKTPDEAIGIPTIASNAEAVRAVRYVLDMFPDSAALTSEVVEEERELIDGETGDVLEHLLSLPVHSLASAVHRGVLTGAIDIPFAPHERNAGRLVTDRGPGRRIRILSPGSVPISATHARREKELLSTRSADRGPLWERLLRDAWIMT